MLLFCFFSVTGKAGTANLLFFLFCFCFVCCFVFVFCFFPAISNFTQITVLFFRYGLCCSINFLFNLHACGAAFKP